MEENPSERTASPTHHCERRDVAPGDVARILRAVLGLPPDQTAPGEQAAFVSLPMPAVVRGIDTGGWIAWCLTGISVFTHDQPPVMRCVYTEAKRIAMSLAMLRSSGNISVAARALGTSRRALREGLRAVGLYPWPGTDGTGPRSDELALSPVGEEVSIGKDGGAIETCARSSDSDRA